MYFLLQVNYLFLLNYTENHFSHGGIYFCTPKKQKKCLNKPDLVSSYVDKHNNALSLKSTIFF